MTAEEKQRRRRIRRMKRILLIAGILVIALFLVLLLMRGIKALLGKDELQAQAASAVPTLEPVVKPEKEVQQHFEELGTVKFSQRMKAGQLQTEEAALADLSDRGFNQYDITSSYDEQGHMISQVVIGADEKAKHPMYETLFIPDEETLWVIYDYNGFVMAKLMLHPSLPDDEVSIYLSQTGTLLCFDSYNKTFYEIVPHSDVAKVFQVARVDSATLKNWVYDGGDVK